MRYISLQKLLLATGLALLLSACGDEDTSAPTSASPDGAACEAPVDCASGRCIGRVCRAPDDDGQPGNNDTVDNNDVDNTVNNDEPADAGEDVSSPDTGADDVPSVDDVAPPDAASDATTTADAMEDTAPDVPIDEPLDCSGLSLAGHSVCGATPESCQIVFYDGSGCRDACASAGLECVASYRDDDDNGQVCAPHPSEESYGCDETGHQSDYCECQPRQRAFEGAEGFGAYAEGGRGGQVFTVTNLNDSGQGSLRWAVERSGRRIVNFDVHGVIQLRSALDISEPYLTIDGRGALDPGESGITIRDYPIDIHTNDVIIRYLRVRLGDYAVLRRVAESGLSRPRDSRDLDCINIDQARNVILDHISMSWSTDEIVSVTNSRNITVQWSILSEPIGNPRTHPYGDDHAYAANNSAATLTYHHNLFAHYRFRGPQFEANDMQRSSPAFDAKFEAVNNVIYGYTSSGSRYRTGFERAADRITSVDFLYHFVGNRYVNPNANRSEIHAHNDYGEEDNIWVHVKDNIGPNRPSANLDQLSLVFTDTGADDPLRNDSGSFAQYSSEPLFTSPAPVRVESASAAHDAVLDGAGCSIERDAIDTRVISDVRAVRPWSTIMSQEDVPGGWESYR